MGTPADDEDMLVLVSGPWGGGAAAGGVSLSHHSENAGMGLRSGAGQLGSVRAR